MRVALVHDYLKEFGGAERVLKTLSEIYPEAPIYTAFSAKGSAAEKEFRDRDIRESWLAHVLKFKKLYSPLRFLIPAIWKTMDLSEYDLVIISASWYITRGFKVGPKTRVICYCHTPPRWLYGYETSIGFQKYWPVRVYAAIVGHFLRMYDFQVAQGIENWIANSENVQARIEKFYRKKSTVIYPPVETKRIMNHESRIERERQEYFLMVSRLVGAKGLEEAVKAVKKTKYKLKIIGEKAGYSDVEKRLQELSGGNIELLGRVNDTSLYHYYAEAVGFIALARDEDFGITVVEAQAAGTPVIAFNGGGFKESVIDVSARSGGATGILIKDTNEATIRDAMRKLVETKWDKKTIQKNAERFSKERFVREFEKFVREIKWG